jgi:ABC-type xylose transport system permease subunit
VLVWLAWFAFTLLLYNGLPLYGGDWEPSLLAISLVGAVAFATISMRTNRRRERRQLGLPVRSWWVELVTEVVLFATALVVVVVWVS